MTTTPDEQRPRERTGAILRMGDALERAGNKLPDPVVLFVVLAVLVVLASFVGARRHVAATHPMTGVNLAVADLLSAEGVRRIVGDAAKSFGALPQLGTALTVLLGVGVAERTGLLPAALRRLARVVPAWALTGLLFFVAVNSAIAGDTGIVLLPPLGALLFLAMGRHPLAGLAAAFSGVTGGFGAGLLLTSMDASLAAITGAAIEGGTRTVDPTSNQYLTWAATLVLTVVGTLVNRRWVEPRLGAYTPVESDTLDPARAGAPGGESGGMAGAGAESLAAAGGESLAAAGGESLAAAGGESGSGAVALTDVEEGRALRFAGVALGASVVVLAALVVPEKGLLRDASGSPKPFFDALPLVAMMVCLVPAAAFGSFAGTAPDHRAFVRTAGRAAADLGGFLVLAFVAAQLMAAFNASNLGPVLVIKGARAVGHAHLSGVPLAVGVAGLSAVLGLFVPSASLRWGMMASAIVPLFVASGFSPEAAQAAFRSGAASGLMVTPLLPFYAVFAGYAKRYAPRAGAGTLLSVTLPHSIAFGGAWLILLGVWLAAGLPLGPGVAARMALSGGSPAALVADASGGPPAALVADASGGSRGAVVADASGGFRGAGAASEAAP